ncbi:MAG TPA: IS481 family transposase [Opitutae bacterium]|nr:IS481 family transposase [Opitutae bacterium]
MHCSLSEAQEYIVVELRKTFLLPLDDLLHISRKFINSTLSRSALARCLKRHDASDLRTLYPVTETPEKKHKTFKDYAPGYLHIDIKYLPKMPDEAAHKYLFVAIDRASRWVHFSVFSDKTGASASLFLSDVVKAFPGKIAKILTDNGKEFTDRFSVAGERTPTGNHPFDKTCSAHKIDHRLTKPRSPQTNGMVERFNGRIADILKSTRFLSAADLAKTLTDYLYSYNNVIQQRSLDFKTPMQALSAFLDNPNLTGPDT